MVFIAFLLGIVLTSVIVLAILHPSEQKEESGQKIAPIQSSLTIVNKNLFIIGVSGEEGLIRREIEGCSPVTVVDRGLNELSARVLPKVSQRHLPIKAFDKAPLAGFLMAPDQRGKKVNRFI